MSKTDADRVEVGTSSSEARGGEVEGSPRASPHRDRHRRAAPREHRAAAGGEEAASALELSVVFVHYRSWDHLRAGLETVLGSALARPPRGEVIVVDNGSAEDSEDSGDGRLEELAAEFPGVRFLESPLNGGYAYGCNAAARAARGRLLLFLNPDVRAHPEDLERLLEEYETHPDVAVLAPVQVDGRGRPQKVFDEFPSSSRSLGWLRALRRALGRRRGPRRPLAGLTRCDWVTGAAVLVSAPDLRRLGGWSEEYWMYSEDVDLCRRARDLGWEVACTPRARFTHLHGGSSRADAATSARTKAQCVIAKHVYAERHLRGWDRRLYHLALAASKLAATGLGALLHAAAAGRWTRMRVCAGVGRRLASYYAGVLRRRDWSDPAAPRAGRGSMEGPRPPV